MFVSVIYFLCLYNTPECLITGRIGGNPLKKKYCCPVKLLLIYKIRADTSHEVSALLVIFAFASKLR